MKKSVEIFLLALGLITFAIMTGLAGCNNKTTPTSVASSEAVQAKQLDGNTPCPPPNQLCPYSNNTPLDFGCPSDLTTTPTPTTCPPLAHEMALQAYKQSGQPWSPLPIPDNALARPGNTIGSIGCFLTCFSMIDGRNPGQLDDLFTADGFFTLNGDLRGWRLALSLLSNVVFKNFWAQGVVSDPDELIDLSESVISLAQQPGNQFIIAETVNNSTGRTHYFQITGETLNPNTGKCDYSIYDPSQRNFQYFSQYDGFETLGAGPWQVIALIGIGASP